MPMWFVIIYYSNKHIFLNTQFIERYKPAFQNKFIIKFLNVTRETILIIMTDFAKYPASFKNDLIVLCEHFKSF